MVERIRTILQVQQLTPTQFADAIGVARPIVSHVLSGRNKPSLEVVQKIIAAFPELSLPWLLSGAGPMLSVAAPGGAGEAVEAVPPPSGPPAARARPAPPKGPAEADPNSLAAPGPAAALPVPPKSAVAALAAPAAPEQQLPIPAVGLPVEKQPEVNATPPPPLPLAALGEPGKSIRRIVIFYHDGTFSDYKPE